MIAKKTKILIVLMAVSCSLFLNPTFASAQDEPQQEEPKTGDGESTETQPTPGEKVINKSLCGKPS